VALLAAGLAAMALRVDKPGGFYSFITAGLGKITGLGAAFAAMMCYYIALLSAYALGGIAIQSLVHDVLHGPSISWWIWAAVAFLAVSALGYNNINLSARVLTLFLAVEFLLMVIYDLVVIARGGAHGLGFDSFKPHEIFSGSLSIGFIFGIGLYGGFEATVIFRDEVKRPTRTIPRATYGAVALLTILYAVTAWVFVNAYGANAVMAALNRNSVGASTASVQHYVGQWAFDAASVLLCTSCFALMLAAHNITARYAFNLSADKILHHSLSKVHRRHASPHRASVAVSVASVIGLAPFVIARANENTIYARTVGVYSYALVILLTLVSLAIAVFLLRRRSADRRATLPAVGSLVAFCLLLFALILSTKNFTLLAGTTGSATTILVIVIYAVIAAGMLAAAYYRLRRPDVYARIGRQDPEAKQG
jgi:amino acid transporter